MKKTSMSVREMQLLLGICKTESYWLVKKGFFEVRVIGRGMRIMLIERKATVDEEKSLFGDEYNDYNLVFCSPIGRPMESQVITHMLKDLIEKHDLPPVVFHSLRHSSITYKLKLSGGDIKMVQGDSGHAQATMVTEQYAHVLDDDRRKNAQRLEQAFYQKKETFAPSLPNTEQSTAPESTEDRLSIIMKLLSDPQTAELLKVLVSKV